MMVDLNLWIALLVFGISLPLAVMSGAALLGLQDTESKVPSLVRLLVCAAIELALLLLFGNHYYIVMLAALACVVALHLVSYWGLRQWVHAKSKISR